MTREEHLCQLWQDGELTAEKIGALYAMTKNAVIGMARRRGWGDRIDLAPRETVFDRMDALQATMDRVLRETHEDLERDRAARARLN